MKRVLVPLLLTVSVAIGLSFAAAPAFADTTVLGGGCTGAATASAACQNTGNTTDPISGSNGLLNKISRIVALFGGVTAVIIMIVAGIMYITANGDSGQISTAKRTIIYASVGLLVIAMGQAIIVFVIDKLG